jgi:hypothetical protein
MTLPKKEEDLQKVVEEVMETQHDHHHHHHHHAESLDDILHTIDVLMDTMNTRLVDLEEKTELIRKEIVNLYKLFGLVVEALAAENQDAKLKAIAEAKRILEESLK